jgi:hypothetical protein
VRSAGDETGIAASATGLKLNTKPVTHPIHSAPKPAWETTRRSASASISQPQGGQQGPELFGGSDENFNSPLTAMAGMLNTPSETT